MKTIKIEKNNKNERIALTQESETFSVYRERENYALGKMAKTWGYIKRNLTFDEATKLFNRRIA